MAPLKNGSPLNEVLAVLNGLDVIVHAGTGSGKTLIFAAPHFVCKGKVSIVVSQTVDIHESVEGAIQTSKVQEDRSLELDDRICVP